jgi:hypothetical protein
MSVAHAESFVETGWPPDVISPIAETPEAFAKEMRVAAALFWYTQGRLSLARAAELAGLTEFGFLAAWSAARLPAFCIDAVDPAARAWRARRSGDAEPSALASNPEEAEAHFRAIAPSTGKRVQPEVEEAARRFWGAAGEPGARWIARRLRWEFNVDALYGAAAALAELGVAAIPPILEELDNNPTTDQAMALVKALAWIGQSPSAPKLEATSVELTLARFLQHFDGDVREWAAVAMRLLPPDRAAYWLRRRQAEETDPYVSQAIAEELTQLQAASG